MTGEELIEEIAEMLRKKHGDPKDEAEMTNLTSDAGRRSVAKDVVDLLVSIRNRRIKNLARLPF